MSYYRATQHEPPTIIGYLAGGCAICGNLNVGVLSNFTYQYHDNTTGRGPRYCPGVSPEAMFTGELRRAGLDVRPDAEDPIYLYGIGVDSDPWEVRNADDARAIAAERGRAS